MMWGSLFLISFLVALLAIDLDFTSQFFLHYPKISTGSVLITGASKGIGKAAALYFHQHGFKVYAGMRKISDGVDLVAQSNGAILPIKVDLANISNLDEIYQTILQNDASSPFVGLVHNAATPWSGPFQYQSEEQLRLTYDVNLVAPAIMTTKFIPLIRKNRGRIVFVSSLSKYLPIPFLGAYVSSKTGLDGLAAVVRAELSLFGAHSSLVTSGSVMTDMNKLYVEENHLLQLDKSVQKEAIESYGCYYSEKQTAHRNGMLNIYHTTKETDEAIFDAVTSSNPKNEYLLGQEGRIIKVLSKLPSWFLDVYFRNQWYPGPHCNSNYSYAVHW